MNSFRSCAKRKAVKDFRNDIRHFADGHSGKIEKQNAVTRSGDIVGEACRQESPNE